ncbi:MAG: Adaptive-response sensory-kinase SasA [Turneriella sp.]|nr:Adaptive-response sensory-kinase SasA [Turneriella sp.]
MRNGSFSLKRRYYQKNIISLLNVEDAIARVQELIDEIFNDTHAVVLYWNDKAGAFIPVKVADREEKLNFRIFDDFILWLGEQDRIFSRHDFEHAKRFSNIRKDALDFFKTTNAEILVPFNLNNSVLAILYLVGRDKNKSFNKKELRFLLEIRDITTVSLSNATLYERLHAMLFHLEEKVKERTSELSNAQAQLIQQEKMASLGVMVAGIAHEINTPTSVVSGAAENLNHNLNLIISTIVENRIASQPMRFLLTEVARVRENKEKKALSATEKFRVAKILTQKIASPTLSEDAAKDRADFLLDMGLQEDEKIIGLASTVDEREFHVFRALVNIDKNLHNMQFALSSILNIVKALKHYSHRDQAEAENVDVRDGIENTLTVFHNQLKHGIRIERHYEDVSKISCNPGELNQIYSNLIVNAVHAMKGQGVLEIFVRERSIDTTFDSKNVLSDEKLEAALGKKSENRYVLISIQDSGSGIPAEYQSKIFDPFFTTKAPGEGTGLGLGIIRNVVLKHKGFLALSSKPGKTRFTIALPCD